MRDDDDGIDDPMFDLWLDGQIKAYRAQSRFPTTEGFIDWMVKRMETDPSIFRECLRGYIETFMRRVGGRA
jgi:hypothetical protein